MVQSVQPHSKDLAPRSDDEGSNGDGDEEEEEEHIPHHDPLLEAHLAKKTSKPVGPSNKRVINYKSKGKFNEKGIRGTKTSR